MHGIGFIGIYLCVNVFLFYFVNVFILFLRSFNFIVNVWDCLLFSDFHELLKQELLRSEYDLGADYMEMIIQVNNELMPALSCFVLHMFGSLTHLYCASAACTVF